MSYSISLYEAKVKIGLSYWNFRLADKLDNLYCWVMDVVDYLML